MMKSVAAKKRGTTFSRYEIAKAEGEPLTFTHLYAGTVYGGTKHDKPIKKAAHPVKYDGINFTRNRNPSLLELYANNATDMYLKRASKFTIEGMARIYFHYLEQFERIDIKENPPVYDRAYVECASFTVTDLYNDIVSMLELEAIYFNCALLKAFKYAAVPFFKIAIDWQTY